MREKLILFDWGNVVESHTTGYTCYDAFNDLFKACGYTGNKNIFTSLGKYKLSIIPTVADFEYVYNQIADEYKFKTTYLEFIKLYKEIFDKIDYYKDVSDYEKSLNDKCCIGIFSDLTVFDKERLNKQVDLSKYDYVFLSFELGLVKPSKDIFEYIQNHVNFDKKDILFIDDKEGNVNSAKEFGWNAYKLTGLELDKIKEVCENFLKN